MSCALEAGLTSFRAGAVLGAGDELRKAGLTFGRCNFCAPKVDATSYITAYIQDSGIVADVLAPYAVLTLWLSLIAGRLIGLKGQMTLIDMRSATGAKRVARHLALWLCMGTLGVLFVVAAHTSKVNF